MLLAAIEVHNEISGVIHWHGENTIIIPSKCTNATEIYYIYKW